MNWIALLLLAAVFESAQPGYRYEFPRDHFAHPAYQTEWWYYTGNLHTADGRRFGYELTFFRHATSPEFAANPSTWDTREIYLAHLALSDIQSGRFYSSDRLNRAGPGLAGISGKDQRFWNGNWQVRWRDSDLQQLQATSEQFTLALDLRPIKALVVHGENGISRKSAGHASHYFSFPRLATSGSLTLAGQNYSVTGTSWFDHEFFSGGLAETQAGWDWFSAHFEDNTDLMLYRLRDTSGATGSYSGGTFIDAQGHAQTLSAQDLQFAPGRTWRSPANQAAYPVEWTLRIPRLQLELAVKPQLDQQELVSPNQLGPSYWEGAVNYFGNRQNRPVRGEGYLEMTGYAKRLDLNGRGAFAVR